jgi:hypothetical protein
MAVSSVYIHTHMYHILLTDSLDRSVFMCVCFFFTANSHMCIYSYITLIRLHYSVLRLSKLVKGTVFVNIAFVHIVNNLCTIKPFETFKGKL